MQVQLDPDKFHNVGEGWRSFAVVLWRDLSVQMLVGSDANLGNVTYLKERAS